ncbi:MAG TPA: hypothetical protein VIH99_11140 [Bdellovibrionota bacterium]|jgi:hypothetical protein
MAEFQPFGAPYFHGGCDMRTVSGADLFAPVSGMLEAGHYSYSTNTDGSMTKYWMPWPEQGDETYFEVAVVGDDGNRYELHHVDRSTLPTEIVNRLNAGGGRIEAGALLGHVIYWPGGGYHHTHYNIVLPSGRRVNPEYASPLLPDHLAPELLGLYAIMPDGAVRDFASGTFRSAPSEFIVDVQDKLDSSVYTHPPTFLRLKFASGQETGWDFRTTLSRSDGAFPPLWDFFYNRLRAPDGSSRYTNGGYGTGYSLIRLKIPQGATGAFTIEVGDIAGNITQRSGVLAPSLE